MTFFEFVVNRWDRLAENALDHIEIVVLAVLIASLIGVIVGVITHRTEWAYELALGVSGTILTIPSLALLGLLIPFLGLGFEPTLVALVAYGLLPIIRNTVTGLRGVNPAILEVARGMGMQEARVLWQVQVPLAWPVILAGIRVATQLTIGIAAIAAYVRGPGLGNDIFTGLSRMGSANAVNQTLAGTLGVVILALGFDLIFVLIRRFTVPGALRV
ncbi:MAG: ABC transporter permease [Phototrophicaceae bacterium]